MPSSALDELRSADKRTNDMTTGIGGDAKKSIDQYRYRQVSADT